MTRFSKRYAESLVSKGIIAAAEKPRYEYGMMLFLTTALGIVSVLLIAILFFNIWVGILYLFLFASLRVCAGGFHCKTYASCFFVSNFIFVIDMLFAGWLRGLPFFQEGLVVASLVTFALIYIIWNAPVSNSCHPLTEKKRKKNRKKAIVIAIGMTVLIVCSLVLSMRIGVLCYVSSIATAVECTIAILMLVEKIKQKGEKV